MVKFSLQRTSSVDDLNCKKIVNRTAYRKSTELHHHTKVSLYRWDSWRGGLGIPRAVQDAGELMAMWSPPRSRAGVHAEDMWESSRRAATVCCLGTRGRPRRQDRDSGGELVGGRGGTRDRVGCRGEVPGRRAAGRDTAGRGDRRGCSHEVRGTTAHGAEQERLVGRSRGDARGGAGAALPEEQGGAQGRVAAARREDPGQLAGEDQGARRGGAGAARRGGSGGLAGEEPGRLAGEEQGRRTDRR